MNNMVVVLEGPDCSGKTQLAERLAIEFGFKVVHTGRPGKDEDLFVSYTDRLIEALSDDQPVVFDRLHIGETVYGPVMRKTDLLGPLGLRLIDRVIAARNVKTVICLLERSTYIPRFTNRGDDYVKDSVKAIKIYNQYHDYYNRHRFCAGVTRYDFEHDDLDDLYYTLFSPRLSLPVGCTGNPLAEVLIVGDSVNSNVLAHDLPFHHLANSSLYLHQSLDLSGLDENNLAFANTFKYTGGATNLAQIVGRMPKFKKAIALGREAERSLRHYNLPHDYVMHPSCAKRFKHHSMKQYARELKKAGEVK